MPQGKKSVLFPLSFLDSQATGNSYFTIFTEISCTFYQIDCNSLTNNTKYSYTFQIFSRS